MPPSDRERTEESYEGLRGEWFDSERRPLLKALGTGAAMSLGSGIAAASGNGSGNGATTADDADSGAIDPVFGYPTTDAANVPDSLEPAHEVEMAVSPPSGPGQPPLLYFDPAGLRVERGDVVQFTAVTPDHTVTAYHPGIGFEEGRVPEDAEPFSSPVLGPGAAWLYRFEHEGVYDMYCGPHHILGMVMRLVVGDLGEGELPEYAESVESLPGREELSGQLNMLSGQNESCEWPFLTPADVLGTDALHPMTVQEMGTVPISAVAAELGVKLGGAETDRPK